MRWKLHIDFDEKYFVVFPFQEKKILGKNIDYYYGKSFNASMFY
jgi:hypothetical protein